MLQVATRIKLVLHTKSA